MNGKIKQSKAMKDMCEMEKKKEKNKFTMVVFLFGGIICSLALFESGVNFFNSISNGFTLSFFAALFAHLFSKNHFSVHPTKYIQTEN